MKKPFKKINSAKIFGALSFPAEALDNIPHIEMTGNSEITVDNCKGIVEFDNDLITVNTGKYLIKITGSDLLIKTYTEKSITVGGLIVKLEFLNNF